jgi:hypothetical protein
MQHKQLTRSRSFQTPTLQQKCDNDTAEKSGVLMCCFKSGVIVTAQEPENLLSSLFITLKNTGYGN